MRNRSAILVTLLALALPSSSCFFEFPRGVELLPGDVAASLFERPDDELVTAPFARVSPLGAGRALRADDEGNVVVSGLPPGGWRMRMSDDRNGDGLEEWVAYRAFQLSVVQHPDGLFGQSDDRLSFVLLGDVELEGVVEIAGTVMRAGGTEPAPGARVFAFRSATLPEAVTDGDGTSRLELEVQEGAEAVTAADGSGAFRFRALAAGAVSLVAFFDDGDERLATAPRVVEAEAGERVAATSLTALELGAVADTRAVQLELAPAPAAQDRIKVALTEPGIEPAPGTFDSFTTTGEREFVFDGSGSLPMPVPVGVWDVHVRSEQGLSAILPMQVAAPGDELVVWGLAALLEREPCARDDGLRDCDEDGLPALPSFDPDDDDAPERTVWVACADVCAGSFGSAGAQSCEAEGTEWDCNDDGDVQSDVTEPQSCLSLLGGTDLDGDGDCDGTDPLPQCAGLDPAAPTCAADRDPALPPVWEDYGGPPRPRVDAGPDDAGFDGGVIDAGFDAGVLDGGVDGGVDADAGVIDVDAGFDAGVGSADAGPRVPRCGAADVSAGGIRIEGTEGEQLQTGFTLEAWVRVSESASTLDQIIVGKHSCGSDNGVFVSVFNQRPSVYIAGQRATGPDPINDDRWHHVAGTYIGTTANLYLDGRPVANNDLQYTTTNSVPWTIGDCGGGVAGNLVDAVVDEVRVSRVLRYGGEFVPPHELAEEDADTLLLYRFHETTHTFAADESSYARDGTLDGAVFVNDCAQAQSDVQVFPFDSDFDNRCNAHAVTPLGDTAISGAQSVHGGGSAFFPDTLDALKTNLGDTVEFGAEDFTIEFWVRPDNAGGNNVILTTGVPPGRWYAQIFGSLPRWRWEPAFAVDLSSSVSVVSSTWYHYAAVRSGSSFTLFLDGQPVASATQANPVPAYNGLLTFGTDQYPPFSGGSPFRGHLDEVRIVKGRALYDASFDPPTRPAGCELRPSCGAELPGTDGHVSIPDDPAFTLGSGDFTVELWARFDSRDTGRRVLVGHDEGPGESAKWILWHHADENQLELHINDAGAPVAGYILLDAPFTPAPGSWHHIAVTRSLTSFELYVDGELTGTETLNYTFGDIAAPLTIGWSEATLFHDGAIADVHLSNVVRYDAPFDPPVQQTADGNTIGLWRLDETSGTVAFDASGANRDGSYVSAATPTCLP